MESLFGHQKKIEKLYKKLKNIIKPKRKKTKNQKN